MATIEELRFALGWLEGRAMPFTQLMEAGCDQAIMILEALDELAVLRARVILSDAAVSGWVAMEREDSSTLTYFNIETAIHATLYQQGRYGTPQLSINGRDFHGEEAVRLHGIIARRAAAGPTVEKTPQAAKDSYPARLAAGAFKADRRGR